MPPTPKPDRNQTVNRLRQHDLRHYRTTDRYARDVQRLYDEAVKDFTELAGTIFAPDPNAPFTFADHPRAKREAARLAVELTKNVQHVIEAGQRSQWIAATYRANDYLGAIINRSKLTPDELKQYEDRNLEGLAAFQGRKVQGLNLSERVWKITDQFTGQMELAIDTTLGQGKSAAELSRDVRNLLNEPNKLFRRVRDKYGNLNLSKAAAAYHPGRGVYRSSAQNAMRLARTEINMAYRTADWERWQNEEHVVGIRIQLSNNHTIKNRKGEDERLIDICDELQGDYPKTFKFVGWHPNCRCTIFPILQRPEEMHEARRARLREIMNGETYKAQPSADLVTDLPEGFKRHIEAIAERSKGWASQPYYIRDNFKGGTIAGGLSKAIPHQSSIGGNTGKPYTPPKPCTEFDAQIDDFKNQAYSLGLDVSRLDSLRAAGDREALKAEIDRLQALSDDRSVQWIAAAGNLRNFIRCCKGAGQAFINKYLDVVKANGYSLKSYYQAAIDALNHAKTEAEKEWQKIKDEEAKKAATKNQPQHPINLTTEQSKNIKDLETALGATCGDQRSQKGANEGKENPHYSKGGGYYINCQTCTVTHYLRRLGFDVEAKPSIPGKKKGERDSAYKELDAQGINWTQRFLNQDGTDPDYQWSSGWASRKGYKIMTQPRINEYFSEHLKADGIYEIYCGWKGGSAHVFLAEVRGGKIQYFDPQSGKEDVSHYLADMKGDSIGVIRIDDKIVNPKIKNLFITK